MSLATESAGTAEKIALMLILIAAAFGAGLHFGAADVQNDWNMEKIRTASATTQAIRAAVKKIDEDRKKQLAINDGITKGKDDEIKQLSDRVAALGRLRHGTGICGGSTQVATASSAAGGDRVDPPTGLVREDVDRDLKSLILAVESDLSTGRACQAFLVKNALTPQL